MQSKIEVHRAKHEAFNRGDLDSAVAVFAESAVYADRARGVVLHGRDEIKGWLAEWKRGFSDAHVTDIEYFASGAATVSRFVGRGTNDGPLGGLPATGREAAFPLCDIFEYDAEGQVVKAEIYYDQLSVLQQLGHVPEPQAAAGV